MIPAESLPALSSSLTNPALEQIADLPAGDRALLAASHLSLLEHLARVPDPRKRRGVRHSLSSVLAAAIAAVMAGAQSFTAIGEWIADVVNQMASQIGGYRASGDALRSYSVCRNAVTLARRRCGCVRLPEAAGRRDRDRDRGLGWPCGVSCERVPR